MKQGHRTVWLDVEIKATTSMALRVNNGERDAWIPRSQIIDQEDDLEIGVETRIEVAEWLAEEKELV
jgi:hypothetical protein